MNYGVEEAGKGEEFWGYTSVLPPNNPRETFILLFTNESVNGAWRHHLTTSQRKTRPRSFILRDFNTGSKLELRIFIDLDASASSSLYPNTFLQC